MFRKDKIHNNGRPQLVRSDHITTADFHKSPACWRDASVSKWLEHCPCSPAGQRVRGGSGANVTRAAAPVLVCPGQQDQGVPVPLLWPAGNKARTCHGGAREGREFTGSRRVCRSAAVTVSALQKAEPGVIGLPCIYLLKAGREGWCRQVPRAESECWAAAICWGVLLGWWQNTEHRALWLKRFQEAADYILILAVWLLLSCAENFTISFCTNTTFGSYIHTNKSRSSKGMMSQATELDYDFLIVISLVISFFLQSLLLDT